MTYIVLKAPLNSNQPTNPAGILPLPVGSDPIIPVWHMNFP